MVAGLFDFDPDPDLDGIFLRWVDEISTQRDRYRDRIMIAAVPGGLLARFNFCILSA